MADVARLLQTLHPMREPPPPSPVAPFLAALVIGVIAALAAIVVWRRAALRRAGLRQAAEVELAATRALAPRERLAAQAHLLRRLVRTLHGDGPARAEGAAWLAALDRAFATTFFSEGDGRAYADARDGADVEALDRSLAGLLARVATSRPGVAA